MKKGKAAMEKGKWKMENVHPRVRRISIFLFPFAIFHSPQLLHRPFRNGSRT
jgi:hypothetical protein